MSIFDVFTFKKEAGKIFTKENIDNVLLTARVNIVNLVKENIPGQDKKYIVDEIVIGRVLMLTATCKNKLVLWLVDRIIDVIPALTQLVYDFLKEKVENL